MATVGRLTTLAKFSLARVAGRAGLATKLPKKPKKPNLNLETRKIGPKIESEAASIAAKGFLRPQRAYQPPEDVEERFKAVCQSASLSLRAPFPDIPTKFNFLASCALKFDHPVPNSLLYTIETVSDALEFYKTPVNTSMPLEALKNIDLPPNLHIQHEYIRFHPGEALRIFKEPKSIQFYSLDEDTRFGGVTAFPKSSTLVTGLKYKKKYRGHSQKSPFEDF